ncbi:VPS10 domain-containing receptor SorCS2 [Pteropus alecto]|uniref:VPS10 domain-containing receptor SorCS2 n=1 Tax=Pteropus alecto TaxID=9402 RepID=L5K6X8_PTEAL|nr:VPS10 domain-containing receptor SorCS2 [Pteropus alecto]
MGSIRGGLGVTNRKQTQSTTRSSDFGTSYTKLALQPGVTTVIDSFYICPTNKRKCNQSSGPCWPHATVMA